MSTTADLVKLVQRLVSPLARRVRLTVSRALVQLVDDTTLLQTVQLAVRADELRDQVERFQQYGFTSVPLPNAEAVLLLVGGDGDHPIVVAVEDRLIRPTGLLPGEWALYTKAHGVRVKAVEADGSLELGTSPTDLVALSTPTKGNDDALAAKINALISVFNAWTPAPNDGGAALKAALASWVASTVAVNPVAATEVKAK